MRRVYTVVLFVVMASIDNTVLALLPTMAPRIGAELQLPNQALGLVIGLNLLVVALAGLVWGYRGDQQDRRRLLIVGTLAWALPVGLIPLSQSFVALLALMTLAGLGLGCISTVGYSIITDLVPERGRGLMLGLFGLSQGIGGLSAGLLAGLLAPGAGWREPFGALALLGLVCSALALLALSPRKGAADEALQGLADAGGAYAYRIQRADLPLILRKATNRWLMAQGFVAQFAFGSLAWLTVLLTARLVAQGLALPLANGIAALLWVILQLGGIVSLVWGWLGDRLRRRSAGVRARLAAVGFWAAVPCYVVLFWVPLPVAGPVVGDAAAVMLAQLGRNAWWWLAVLGATLGVIAQSANAPNWFALLSETNLPEHRGTAYSFVTLSNNLGRALGALLVGASFDWLARALPSPANYALGLTLFQLFFIPAGFCFWRAARTSPADIAAVQATLRGRVEGAAPPRYGQGGAELSL